MAQQAAAEARKAALDMQVRGWTAALSHSCRVLGVRFWVGV